MSRKRNNNPFAYVDGIGKGTPFAILSDTQAKSPTYQKLSDGAKYVLMVCRLCRQFHSGTDKDGRSRNIQGNILYFYFNREIQKRYGLNNPNKVRRELVELVQNGFVDVIENNSHRHIKNVYAFSSKWAELDKGQDIELSNGAKIFIQGKN